MIPELKWLIDECEDKPPLKALLLKIAELPENKQGIVLRHLQEHVMMMPLVNK